MSCKDSLCAHTHTGTVSFCKNKIYVDYHHAEKIHKKGIMKIEGHSEGIMIGLLLMEVWR